MEEVAGRYKTVDIYISYPVADITQSADNQPTDAKWEVEISKPTGLNKLQINKGVSL